jgi:membrane dipeptidase
MPKGKSMTSTIIPIFDGHNDTLLRCYHPGKNENRPFLEEGESGHIDLPRARRGGLAGGLFAIFVPTPDYNFADNFTQTEKGYAVKPSPAVDPAYAKSFTQEIVASLFAMERASEGQIQVARTSADLTRCIDQGTLAIVLHFEGAETIDEDLSNLSAFYEAGLRSLGLVWSRPNVFAEGVPFAFPGSPDSGAGLTEAGKKLVRACNDLGIMLDLSHLNEKGFWDVAALSTAPLVASHSCAHVLSPSPRNLTDQQLDAIKASDGLVGVNFAVSFTRPDGKNEADTPVTEIARHVRYIADRIGGEHVALGSDFDGTTIPNEMGDVTGLPKLIDALRAQGFDEAALAKIAYRNWLRILDQTWHS